jgi:hypothetical protein
MQKTSWKEKPNADLVRAVRKHRKQILEVYDENERPLIVLDLEHRKLRAYPYEDYKGRLRENAREALHEEYVKAVAKNKVLVLVWDKATRRLVANAFRRDRRD